MNNMITCRICYESHCDDNNDDNLIEPCHCTGTVAKVHRWCLEKWLNSKSDLRKCELCLFEFNVKTLLKYRMVESISIWFRQSTRCQELLHDSLFFGSITIISMLMMWLIIYGAIFVYKDNDGLNQLPHAYFISLCVVGILWIIILISSIVMFFKLQIGPWYRWWRSTKQIIILSTH